MQSGPDTKRYHWGGVRISTTTTQQKAFRDKSLTVKLQKPIEGLKGEDGCSLSNHLQLLRVAQLKQEIRGGTESLFTALHKRGRWEVVVENTS